MAEGSLRDPELAALAIDLGLRHAGSPDEWRHNALTRLGAGRFEQLQSRRAHLANNPSSEADFYDFVTADLDLTLAMLEGRLGYYEAVLPVLAEALRGIPHARVLDLGSYVGLASLYLARRFPDSLIIGIDRCEGAVRHARAFQEATHAASVEFRHGDYARSESKDPFDVVLSLQTVPTYWLPQIPSESPESYERGNNRVPVASDPSSPARHVADALAAIQRLAGEQGHVFLHERLPDFSRTSLFLYLLNKTGLRIQSALLLQWRAANEREGIQKSPLFVASPRPGPVEFDESHLITMLLSESGAVDCTRVGVEQPALLHGTDAQRCYLMLPSKDEVCVRGAARDGNRFAIHLGTADTNRVFVYTCTTSDYRELKVCAAQYVRMLFAPVVEQLLLKHKAGEIADTEPDPRGLGEILRAKFAAFGYP